MSLLKKIVAVATVLTVFVWVGAPAQATTVEELEAQIAALLEQLSTLQSQLATLKGETITVTGCTITSFDRNLKVGMTGDDVKCLQIVLNSDPDTKLADEGVGSPGNETTYFGPLTKAAVIKFQEKYASDVLAPWGLTAGTGFVGSTTRAKLNEILGGAVTPTEEEEEEEVPVEAGLTIELAADTPAAGTLVAGQGLASLAKFTFINGDSTEVKVTQLKLTRLGVSADATLSNVYLFDGATRLTDSASVSSGVITFTDTAGIFTIPAGTSKTITVKSDIDSGTNGQTVGVGVNTGADITTDASAVNGTFPINGNLMSIATATLAGVDFNATTTPSTASVDPQDDYTVWQNVVTITTRAVNFTRFSLREIGTIDYSDLQNFRLYVDGVQVGSAVANLDDDGYVTFDLSASPKKLEAGARTIKVVADIIGGSSRNFKFSLRKAADAEFIDTQYGVTVLPTANSSTFTARTTGIQTVNSGTITITKMSDSPAGNVVNGAPAVTLAKYEVKAAGEKVKIESLRVAVVVDDSNVGYLRNGMLLANGVQVGSTSNLYDTDTSPGYTTFSLGSSLIVEPGSPVTLEVVADIYDNAGDNDLSNGDTIQARIVGGDLDNAQGLVSLATIDAPSSSVDGNQLTVAEGDLTLSKYTAYTNQTLVAPLTAAKLAHFTLTAGTTEDVNINTITVDFDNSNNTGAFDASDDLSNLYVTYGGNTTNVKATVSDSGNSWSINYVLEAGTTIDVIVYADVDSSAYSASTTDTLQADMTITGTTAESATTATGGETSGQTITFGSGTFVAAKGDDTPLAQIVAGDQTVTGATFKFTALYDTFTIKELKVAVSSATVSGAIVNATLKDGSTELATQPFSVSSNTVAYFTGLDIEVPSNTSKTLTVDLNLSTPSATTSTSQVNAALTLTWMKYANSQGVETSDDSPEESSNTTDQSNDPAGNALYVYKSIPTFTYSALSGSTFINGSQTDIYEFKVAADSKGAIGIKQIKASITWDDGGDGDSDTLELESFKFFRDGTDITNYVTMQDASGNSVESTSGLTESDSTLVITFDTEEIIGAGEEHTYKIAATPQNFGKSTTGSDGFSIRIAADSSHNGTKVYLRDSNSDGVYGLATSNSASESAYNIIWSDRSSLTHSYTNSSASNDWADSYLVKNLDLSSKGWYRQ